MYGLTSRCRLGVLLLASAALTGCGDARIKKLTAGIARDSVLKILAAEGTSADSLPHVYRAERYLLNGVMTEVLFYTPTDAKERTDSTVAEKTLTPIVLRDGKVTGWGWTHFDSVALANHIRVVPR